ncbi:class I SAM-dependent methyltransferase [Marinobacter pelagius]|uniref:16S rRNA (Guanine1207-N2)-methyltransferase n=1 Tax=Marinobacter pelagius TaxID=379482 RepID=A0A1I4TRD8_9GAMM|nr:class I SAM-dependent methyltransferase [Marinobacter pelagius]SFM79255.1 16S rRNA (guanine1207-N2)-methyltransferase [Marinobacter pelagius]
MTSAKLQTPDGPLLLVRPGGGDKSLRAWDAADELLLDTAATLLQDRSDARVLIVDDQFGALSLGLARFAPELVADNAGLTEALAMNARANPSVAEMPRVTSWQDPPEGSFDLVVLRIPRQADYLAWLLRWLNGVLSEQGRILAGGMIKHLPDRSVDVFAEAVVTEQVFPARKKARVVMCSRGQAGLNDWPGLWKGYALDNGVRVEALPAVFAREKLDIGTRLLLPHVTAAVSALGDDARVLDLACGNGVLGLQALSARRELSLTFTDVSSQAVLSARHNVSRAFPGIEATFHHADGIPEEAGAFDLILLNPPFHEGGVVGDHIALRLFRQAARHLAPGGRLLMVGNRHLGYHRTLKRDFPKVSQLDADPKFVVFQAGRS